jgi:hypothetical protein
MSVDNISMLELVFALILGFVSWGAIRIFVDEPGYLWVPRIMAVFVFSIFIVMSMSTGPVQ